MSTQSREGACKRVFGIFCVKVVETIRSMTAGIRMKALAQFHQLSIKKLPSLWKGLYAELGLPMAKALMLQSVKRQLLNLVLLEQKCTPQRSSATRSVVMPSEEENAVQYASGYVAMKVVKQFEKGDSKKAAQFVDCLSHIISLCIFHEINLFCTTTTVVCLTC